MPQEENKLDNEIWICDIISKSDERCANCRWRFGVKLMHDPILNEYARKSHRSRISVYWDYEERLRCPVTERYPDVKRLHEIEL